MFERGLAIGRNEIKEKAGDRKGLFLNSQAILPRPVDDKEATGSREIVINLDTENNWIDVRLGEELISNNQDKFFAFDLLGKRSRKIYFSTNNLYYHLISLDEMITYIQENMDNRYPEFTEYLSSLREKFYKKDENQNWVLNPNKLKGKLKKKFYKYSDGDYSGENIKSVFQEFVSKEILGSTRKYFVKGINICTLKVDGFRAHEDGFPFKREYIDVVYYDRQGRFFDSSEPMVREKAVCSGCQKQKKVTGKIDIPTKFYITDKPTFFEGIDGQKAYKSFALCEDCYQELMIGIDHIANKYSSNLFGTSYYLIPQIFNVQDLDEKMYFIKEQLSNSPQNSEDEVGKHRNLIKEMRSENLRFDFLFHWTPSGQGAAFVVAEYISDVEYSDVDNLFKTIQSFKTGYYSSIDSLTVGFRHIYWLLFPNKDSHSNPDTNLYRKDLLHIFKSLMKHGVIHYSNVINKFLSIYSKTKYRKQQQDFSFTMRPLQMNMLLSILYHNSNLQGIHNMKTSDSYTDINNEDVKDFFKTHPEVYQDNRYRQGLVLLGVLMNQILKKQNKQGKSSNIMEKLNFDGMPVRRLPRFVEEISKYLTMRTYDLYQYNSVLHAAMLDRLHNIENSEMSKDEVVFYVLTGISLSSYIGYQHKQEKQKAEVTDE